MEIPTDVERMFSWLKTPDLKYREFEGAREINDAVASWPALHRVAGETGREAPGPAPVRDRAARERIARDTAAAPRGEPLRPTAGPGLTGPGPTGPGPTSAFPPGGAATRPEGGIGRSRPMQAPQRPAVDGGNLMSVLGQRLHAKRLARMGEGPAPEEPRGAPQAPESPTSAALRGYADRAGPARDHPAPPLPPHAAPTPAAEASREGPAGPGAESADALRRRLDAVLSVNPRPVPPLPGASDDEDEGRYPARADRPLPEEARRRAERRDPAPRDRTSLFGGAYRPEARDGGRRSRRGEPLSAVFSRLAGDEPEDRGGERPGLGPVFGRLR